MNSIYSLSKNLKPSPHLPFLGKYISLAFSIYKILALIKVPSRVSVSRTNLNISSKTAF